MIGLFVEEKGVEESGGSSDGEVEAVNDLIIKLILALGPNSLKQRIEYSLHQ